MIASKEYSLTKYNFPSEDIPISKRDKKWHKDYCEAIYARYVNDQYGIPYSRRLEMIENRAYGAGTQSTTKYNEQFFEWQSDDPVRASYVNINKEVMPIIPKFRAVFVGLLMSIKHKSSANSIGPLAFSKRLKLKNKIWLRKVYSNEFKDIESKLGIQEQQDRYIPNSKEELDMFMEIGGFKLAIETAIESGLNYCTHISNWDRIEQKIYGDLFDQKFASIKVYTDPDSLDVKARYVDVVNSFVQYTKTDDYNNSPVGGEIIEMYIHEIKRMCKDEIKKGIIKEEDFRQLADKYNGKLGNYSFSDYNYDNKTGNYPYDNIRCYVMDVEFICENKEYDNVIQKGNDYVIMKGEYGKVKNTKKRKTIISKNAVVHKAKWVVNTDITFDFGLVVNTPRNSKEEPQISFKFISYEGKSPVELTKLSADKVQLYQLKLQNLIAMAAPPGLAVEWSSINNINISGEGDAKPLTLLQIRKQRGDFLYKATTHRGHMNLPTGKPIQELQGGIGQAGKEFIELIEYEIEKIRDITGINRIADASNPDPSQSVGGSQLAYVATNNSLKPIYLSAKLLKEYVFNNMSSRLKDLLAYSEGAREKYASILGEEGVDITVLLKDFEYSDLSIKIEELPDENQRMKIEEAAMVAMKPGKEGVPSIGLSEWFMIQRLLNAGNYKFIHAFLSAKEAKTEEISQQKAQQNQAMNAEIQRQSEQSKTERELIKIEKEAEKEKDVLITEYKLKGELEDKEHINRVKEIEKEGEFANLNKTS